MTNDDYNKVFEKVPFNGIFNDEQKKNLYSEFIKVECLDAWECEQKYFRLNSNGKTPADFDNDPEKKKKLYELAKAFSGLKPIPTEYMVPDITKTPTCKALMGIQKEVEIFKDQVKYDIDTSQKAKECATNIIRISGSIQDKSLIEDVFRYLVSDETNLSIDFARWDKKDVLIWEERWRALKSSFDAQITEYLNINSIEQKGYTEKGNHERPLSNCKINCDKSVLGSYFTPEFKGIRSPLNYLDMFVEELQMPRSAKAFAQIALMCFEGKQMNNRKGRDFSKWYKKFCEIVGCEHKKYDNRKKLRNSTPECLKRLFLYLE